jgi:NAD-dependent DNA ligase
VVSAPGLTRQETLEDKLQSVKEKKDEEVSADQRIQRKTLATIIEAKKIGAEVIADDELEPFFAKRQRKLELLRGKTTQPGRSTFFVAGETKERSVAQTRAWIKDHGGVPVNDLTADVDYVVVGSGLDQAFFEKVKKLGVKVMREDELGWFFGLQ